MRKFHKFLNNQLSNRLINKFLKRTKEQTLRRSTRVRKSTNPNDYIMCLQELDYNIGAKNNLETFSQAMSSKESNSWYSAMKEEMNSMVSNRVWDLVEFPDGVKVIGCKSIFKTKRDSLGNIERHKAKIASKGFTQMVKSTTRKPFLMYLRNILFA